MIILTIFLLLISCQEVSVNESFGRREDLKKSIHHKSDLTYKEARRILMGEIHLEMTRNGPVIEDVYCLKKYTNKDIRSRYKIGRNKIPDFKILNVEHVWPKSRFFSKRKKIDSYEHNLREADLHILYPSATYLNSERSSYKFGEVIDNNHDTENFPCSTAQLGPASFKGKKLKDTFFEPPKKSKGNIARAMFYFSVRYNEPISFYEESFLRKWHELDPPDSFEKKRNKIIEKVQGNRNPFIDNPDLVERIKDF